MTPATLTWFVIGAILVYVVAQDGNVYDWLVLQSKVIKVWTERQWYKLRYHPESPWVRYEMKRNSERIAREIMKEIENR